MEENLERENHDDQWQRGKKDFCDRRQALVKKSAERIYGITYQSSSPYFSEGIHTLVLPWGITQRSHDPGIA
jgi:hypothetical protein